MLKPKMPRSSSAAYRVLCALHKFGPMTTSGIRDAASVTYKTAQSIMSDYSILASVPSGLYALPLWIMDFFESLERDQPEPELTTPPRVAPEFKPMHGYDAMMRRFAGQRDDADALTERSHYSGSASADVKINGVEVEL